MLCRNPFMAGTIPFGCGQCLPCRINRGRQWMWRQYLESLCHADNSFVTLTYDARHIAGNWQLQPRDLQLFIKSLREAVKPHKFRYYAVGEYGSENRRPHYHISLFGLSGNNVIGDKPIAEYGRDRRGNELVIGGRIFECWGRGRVSVDEFNHLTAQYVAGYVVKKLTDRKRDEQWIVPEFARMSLRPGIGARAMATIAESLYRYGQVSAEGELPGQLRIGKKTIPIGRYLLSKLADELGMPDEVRKSWKAKVSFDRSVELQAVLKNSSRDTFKAAYLEDIEGQILRVEARANLYKKRG